MLVAPYSDQVSDAATTTPSKQELRHAHLLRRAARGDAEQERAATGFRDQLLALPEVARSERVTAFLSQHGEPGTGPLIEALCSRGVTVLVPLLRADFDLDWGVYQPDALTAGRFGLLVPTTPAEGVHAVASVSVVVCPGVAVDLSGRRLGRGGGSYDRALRRCGPAVLRVQVVYDDEVVDVVPTEPHDEPVDAIVTPTRSIRVSRR
jgi:5-formyltetrahydrofolate cyclo-ligase